MTFIHAIAILPSCHTPLCLLFDYDVNHIYKLWWRSSTLYTLMFSQFSIAICLVCSESMGFLSLQQSNTIWTYYNQSTIFYTTSLSLFPLHLWYCLLLIQYKWTTTYTHANLWIFSMLAGVHRHYCCLMYFPSILIVYLWTNW